MKLAELLAQLRSAPSRSLSFQANNLQAAWSCGDNSATLEAAAADDGSPKLPTFTLRAYNGGFLEIGWGAPVVIDLAGMKISDKSRPIFKDHQTTQVVGHSTETANNGKNVVVKGIVSGTGPAATEVVSTAKNGFPWQASVGCRVLKATYIPEKESVACNGKTWKGPLYYVESSILTEVSFVALGGDDTTSALVASRSNQPKEPNMDPKFEAWLKARNLDPATLAAAAITALEADWKASGTTSDPPPKVEAKSEELLDTITARRAAEAAEVERIAAIREKTTGHPKIEAQAIREGWTAEKAELTAMRASRPQSANIHTGGTSAATPTVIEAAACMSLGLRGERIEKAFSEQTLEAATKLRGIGLQEILLMAAVNNGYSPRPGACKSDLRNVLVAAFSSVDIGGILSNIANKFALESFMAVEQTWRQVASIRPANDFKTMTSYRLTGNLQFEKVGPSGEIKHGTLGNDSMTNKVDTHAKMLAISRENIINDDLGALQKVPSMMGRGGALQLNEVFWTAFLDNASFFTSGRGNYASGAGTALGVDSLTAAELLALNQTDSDGKPLGIMPKLLLVPNALNVKAAEITKSLELRDTTASTKFGVSNPHAGKFEAIRSSYLSNATIAGSSALAWYLLADPRDLAVIEVAFLNGVEAPTIESSDADFHTLGIQMRGVYDFGVAKQEYRAGVKMKGAA